MRECVSMGLGNELNEEGVSMSEAERETSEGAERE